MNSDPFAVQEVLRAMAEARDADFYRLWVTLQQSRGKPIPKIGFRIFQVADCLDAHVVVSVQGTRPDGVDVCWSVSMRASSELLVVDGTIELGDDTGTRSVFEISTQETTARGAATLIGTTASDVCRQTHWWSDAGSAV